MARKPKTEQVDIDELLRATSDEPATEPDPEPVDDSPIDLVLPDEGLPRGLRVEMGESFYINEQGEQVMGERPADGLDPLRLQRSRIFEDQRDPEAEPTLPGLTLPTPPPAPVLPSLAKLPIVPNKRYATRVDVIEAYQFDNQLHKAPDWVDRNWLAYHDGPVIDVPQSPPMPPVHCKVGDWIVYQERMNEDGSPMMRELVVYPDQAFRLLFREVTNA
jgi:hypothetical protein